jgi:integrase
MASISFRVRGKTSPGNILIRLKQGDRFDYEIATGLKVSLEHWSQPKQKVKNIVTATYKDYVNNKMGELKLFIESEYYKVLSIGEEVSQKWLRENVNNFFNRLDSSKGDEEFYFTSFAENFIKESRGKVDFRSGKSLTERTIGYYETTINKIKDYEEFVGKRVKINEVNLEFHESFVNFLANKQFLNLNTVGFYISKLIMFCKAAERKGLKISMEYKDPNFFAPSNKTYDIYLKKDEIDRVFNLELPLESKLDNARDWFIIGLWTGLRVSDLLQLNENNIEDSLINITNKKTDIPVIIPLHEQVKTILDKRQGRFPRKISDQKFNDYIKDVCELAEINEPVNGSKMSVKMVNKKKIYRKKVDTYKKFELVSSHICRRSFATNHYGKGNLDTLTIMKITGHKTEKSFLEYIKVTPEESALKLREFWKNQNN